MVYAIQVCWQLVPSWSCSQAVWHKPLLCLQWKTADDGQRNCPKHVEFYSKNKFEKLVHLVGFIIRMYHDARSPERQSLPNSNILIPVPEGVCCTKTCWKITNCTCCLQLLFLTQVTPMTRTVSISMVRAVTIMSSSFNWTGVELWAETLITRTGGRHRP